MAQAVNRVPNQPISSADINSLAQGINTHDAAIATLTAQVAALPTQASVVSAATTAATASAKTYTDSAIGAANWSANGITSQVFTSSFTLNPTHLGKVLECNFSSAGTVTVPPSSAVSGGWPVDAALEIFQYGTGQVSVVGGSGVTVRLPPSPSGSKTRGQNTSIVLRKRNTIGTALDTSTFTNRWRGDDITGLANGGAISSWAPAIGTAASQATAANQPTWLNAANGINGHAVVHFDGNNDMFALSGASLNAARNLGNLVIYVVYRLPSTLPTNARSLFSLSTGTTTGARVSITQNVLSTNVHRVSARRADGDGFANVDSSAGSSASEVAVLTAVLNWANRAVYLYKNGTLVASNTTFFSAAGLTSDTASLTGYIGANANGSGEWFSGDIAEVITQAADGTVASTRANVHTALGNTYNVAMADSQGIPDEWVLTGDSTA